MTEKSTEYATFTKALGKVLQVSHEQMKVRIEAAKEERKTQPKSASSPGHGKRDKG